MAPKKGLGKLLLYSLFVGLLLFRLVEVVTSSKGLFLRLEFSGLLLLSLLSLIGLASYSKSYGEKVLSVVFFAYVVNMVLIWHLTSSLYLVPLLLAMVGFLMSMPRKTVEQKEFTTVNEPASVVFDNPEPKVEIVHEELETVVVNEEAKVTHSPGKYVASKRSNIYHEPKCEWAKKIKENGRLWFPEMKDAQKKGYRKHSCVK